VSHRCFGRLLHPDVLRLPIDRAARKSSAGTAEKRRRYLSLANSSEPELFDAAVETNAAMIKGDQIISVLE
jgi:hypothetical protein